MAYISGYEYDIFISYSHVDNKVYPDQKDGWVDRFYTILKYKLAERFGETDLVKIWWDNKELRGNSLFNDLIAQAVNNSAIFICLDSYGYMASDYCIQELNVFCKKAQIHGSGLNVDGHSRIIHLLLYNIPYQDRPAQLAGTSGFSFCDTDEHENVGNPIETDSKEFQVQLRNVTEAIWRLAQGISEKNAAEILVNSKKTVEKSKEDFTIYLGEVADTLRLPRKRIITELQKKGFNVVAGIPPPDEAIAHEQTTKEALQQSDLAIHLLDEYPGREITDAPEIWYPQKQTELALQTNKAQMIWVPAEANLLTIEDENYKNFLQDLETGKLSSKEYEFVRSSKGTLMQEIINLAEKLKAKKILRKKPGQEKLAVLLDTHLKDERYALDLSKALFENQVWTVINPQEDDPRKNIELLDERISRVNKLIFLYGTVSKEWVQERIYAALRLIITNDYPVDEFFIYMAPPKKEENEISIRQKFIKINIIDSSSSQVLDKVMIQQFLNTLKPYTA